MEVSKARTGTSRNALVKDQKKRDEVEFELIEQCLVIMLKQDLDHHSSLSICEKTDKMIDRGNVKHIIFDFESTNFMDSSGIGVVMGRYKRLMFTGGKVAVTNVSDTIDRILKLSGLYKIIAKYPSNQDALDNLIV